MFIRLTTAIALLVAGLFSNQAAIASPGLTNQCPTAIVTSRAGEVPIFLGGKAVVAGSIIETCPLKKDDPSGACQTITPALNQEEAFTSAMIYTKQEIFCQYTNASVILNLEDESTNCYFANEQFKGKDTCQSSLTRDCIVICNEG